jgi:hypothetical protein
MTKRKKDNYAFMPEIKPAPMLAFRDRLEGVTLGQVEDIADHDQAIK